MSKVLIFCLAFISLDAFEIPASDKTTSIKNPFLPKSDPSLKLTIRRKYIACDFSSLKIGFASFPMHLDTSIVLVKHLYPLPEFRLGVKF